MAKVENLTNSNGRKVENQFVIFTPEATFFQSYNSIIVKTTFEDGKRKIYLDKNKWDYSKTTSKYRNQFLGKTTKEIENAIKNGEIELIDLNRD